MSCQFFLWNIQLVSNETSQWHKCEMELPKKEFLPTRLFRRLMKNVMAGSCTVWPHSPGASARPFFRRCLDWDILTNGIGIHQLVGLTWTTELRLNQLLTCNYRFETKRGKYHLTITRLVQPFFQNRLIANQVTVEFVMLSLSISGSLSQPSVSIVGE